MVSHLFYYQLALLALIWLFVMLHLTGSKPGLPAPPVPAKPKRKRSPEPKAFEGLTHKPHCVLCDQATGETNLPPPVRPAPMPLTNRRPRTVDGRVPETCGYCLEASPVPSAWCPPASRQASNQIFSLSLSPPCLV